MAELNIIEPSWPAPGTIRAFTTTRDGGVSTAPYATFNLAAHVGDNLDHVQQNRRLLQRECHLPTPPVWLNQTHSHTVYTLESDLQNTTQPPTADASYTTRPDSVCAVLTADCLPVLLCNRQGTEVAAVHTGWRGYLNGILANAIAHFQSPPQDILAWLGPAIGPDVYEVGQDLFDAFVTHNGEMASAFTPRPNQKYLANLYQLATLTLASAGVNSIFGGKYCTYTDNKSFFSYRHEEGITGRMASVIWISK